jgi:hypothetical protein
MRGATVGWNDATRQFSVNGNWFDSGAFSNFDDRLYATPAQLEELLKSLGMKSYDTGGYITHDQVAKIHAGERILTPIETLDLHSILPKIADMTYQIHALQERMIKDLLPTNIAGTNERIYVDINSPVHVSGIATDKVVAQMEGAIKANNQQMIDNINKSLNKSGIMVRHRP